MVRALRSARSSDRADTREEGIERPASGHVSVEAVELPQWLARHRDIEKRTRGPGGCRPADPSIAAVVRAHRIGVAPLVQQVLELILQARAKIQSQQTAWFTGVSVEFRAEWQAPAGSAAAFATARWGRSADSSAGCAHRRGSHGRADPRKNGKLVWKPVGSRGAEQEDRSGPVSQRRHSTINQTVWP